MSLTVPISPVSSYPGIAIWLSLSDFYAIPNTTLNCQYQLLDSGSAVLAYGRTSLTSGQYQGWDGTSNDDQYLPACYAQVLGLTIVTGG